MGFHDAQLGLGGVQRFAAGGVGGEQRALALRLGAGEIARRLLLRQQPAQPGEFGGVLRQPRLHHPRVDLGQQLAGFHLVSHLHMQAGDLPRHLHPDVDVPPGLHAAEPS